MTGRGLGHRRGAVSPIARAMPKSITLTAPVRSEHDVGRLDVAVHDAVPWL